MQDRDDGQTMMTRPCCLQAAPISLEGAGSRWRGDLRLFLTAWAAGFLFFMILIG